MSYRQLTEGQRYQISALLSEEFSQREIARKLNIAPSTVHRELRRNNNLCGSYDPQKAQERMLKRRSKPKPKRVCENTRNAVELMLEMDWSPGADIGYLHANRLSSQSRVDLQLCTG